ncbi:hypothetical protein Salat_1258900 [Sesamum alatum]|uniref:Uncharacterized protein n=1 Tax=Sesamum alatum TaxID=300844 RepID=A0AAE1YHA6_9LAMI|nr:hypothetical protein Salat_1258900 [Sesamum alatum]
MSSANRFIITSITKFMYSPYCTSRVLASNTRVSTQSSGYRYPSSYTRMQNYNTHTRKFSVYSVQPGAPLPPQPPSSSLSWILGIVLTIILPFVGNKWGPLLKFKTEFDTAIETIEEIVEVVEKVAEVVDKVAEDISDDLPDGGKLKKVVDVVEDVAEKTAQDARTVGDVIDKAILNLNENQRFQTLRSAYTNYDNTRRDFAVYSSVEPGVPPPTGPPSNILSWIVGVAIAIVVPFVNYKWGPLLKNKIETAMKMTEDVVEAVEKVAGEVEKVAEDIADDLPEGGKLREAVDFVEKVAERAAKDAGAVDDFIDKVQEEQEKAESFVESLEDESVNPPKESKDQNLNK